MLKVLFDRVYAKEEARDLTLKSGITINEKAASNLRRAKVLSTGDGCFEYGTFVPMTINVGDTIVYEEHVAIRQKIDDECYVILRQIDVLGIEKE